MCSPSALKVGPVFWGDVLTQMISLHVRHCSTISMSNVGHACQKRLSARRDGNVFVFNLTHVLSMDVGGQNSNIP